MTKRRFFSGESIEQALLEAAGYHGLEPAQVAWRQIEKRHGFLRMRRNVVIEVDPEAPRRAGPEGAEEARRPPVTADAVSPVGPEVAAGQPTTQEAEAEARPSEPEVREEPEPSGPEAAAEEPSSPEVVSEGTSRPEGAPEALGEALASETGLRAPEAASEELGRQEPKPPRLSEREIREALELLLELSDLAVDPHVTTQGASASVDLRGPEEEFLRENEGELLKVFEHLSIRMLGGAEAGIETFRIDSDGYREKRDEELRRRALEAARQVASGGEEVLLEPMDPADRRVVHLAVEGTPGVTTRSQGRGEEKRVLVTHEKE
jgi:spoIIIJ-associated protein